MTITAESTLRTLVSGLKNPEEFVRRALGNMLECTRDCQVRVVLDSNTAFPDYVVEMLFDDVVDGEEIEHSQPTAFFKGRNHQGRLIEPADYDRPWSSEAMRFEEVQALIGELRNFTPKPRPKVEVG